MALVGLGHWNLPGGAMFTFFRYGLAPVVFFCVVVIAASIDAYWTNASQKSTWRQTVVTVMASQDFGQKLSEFRGTPSTFPDPRGTLKYVIDGEEHIWQGRGRDIGLTVMKPGDKINIYYNPKNPRDINTLVLLGASTGNIILASAVAFLAFYVWFFWLGRFRRRSGPDDFDGAAGSFADRAPERLPDPIERSRPTGKSFDRGSRATFGRR